MERKIGETFEYEGKIFKVKEDKKGYCYDCFFNKRCTLPVIKMVGECAAGCREDNKGVVFVEVQEQTQKTKEAKERKIGETFEFEGHKLKVVDKDGYGCDGCFFLNRECSLARDVSGFCSREYRTDKKRVIFVEAKDEQPQDEHPQELNLCEILKDCPKGTKFYSTVFGDVRFKEIVDAVYPIVVSCKDKHTECFRADGKVMIKYDGECCIFPSKEMRDWSKFTAPWLKKERFDPKTLKPFDRVIIRNVRDVWTCTLFSHISNKPDSRYIYVTCESVHKYCIPYNDETKHLVGTKEEAPVFYRYWED